MERNSKFLNNAALFDSCFDSAQHDIPFLGSKSFAIQKSHSEGEIKNKCHTERSRSATSRRTICILLTIVLSLISGVQAQPLVVRKPASKIICGAERLDMLLPLIRNKNVALMVNQTSVVGGTPLIDTLVTSGVHIKKYLHPSMVTAVPPRRGDR